MLAASFLFLVFKLKNVLDLNTFGIIQEYLYYVYAAVIIILIILSIFNSLSIESKRSEVFFAIVMSFLLSDVLLMIGYYQNYFFALQIERFFQISAISMLFYYVFVLFNKEFSKEEVF